MQNGEAIGADCRRGASGLDCFGDCVRTERREIGVNRVPSSEGAAGPSVGDDRGGCWHRCKLLTESFGYCARLTKDFAFEGDGLVLRSATPFPRERLEQRPEPGLVRSWVAVCDGLLPG